MDYRKVIEVNPYSRKSINSAIKELKDEKKAQEKLVSAFVKEVGRIMAERIQKRYGEVNNTNKNKVQIDVWSGGYYGKAQVIARGQGLYFIEFGTGVGATSGFGWQYGFYPGSWSEEHARTFQTYMLSGGKAFADNDGNYIYNNEAADAFVQAIGHLEEIVKEAADEVFR